MVTQSIHRGPENRANDRDHYTWPLSLRKPLRANDVVSMLDEIINNLLLVRSARMYDLALKALRTIDDHGARNVGLNDLSRSLKT